MTQVLVESKIDTNEVWYSSLEWVFCVGINCEWEKLCDMKQKHSSITVGREKKKQITTAHRVKGLHFCWRTNLAWRRKKSEVRMKVSSLVNKVSRRPTQQCSQSTARHALRCNKRCPSKGQISGWENCQGLLVVFLWEKHIQTATVTRWRNGLFLLFSILDGMDVWKLDSFSAEIFYFQGCKCSSYSKQLGSWLNCWLRDMIYTLSEDFINMDQTKIVFASCSHSTSHALTNNTTVLEILVSPIPTPLPPFPKEPQ